MLEWPLYKKELLQVGNPSSCAGLCTLWTEKEKVLKQVSSENYLIAGQCYSHTEGISLIIRHSLANKNLRYIVLCGADLNHTGDALLALKQKGVEDRKIIGFGDSEIHSEISSKSIENFRENVEIIDKRDVHDFKELNQFLASLPKKPSWGNPEIFAKETPKALEKYPSEQTGFVVRGKTIGETWIKILDTVLRFGHVKKSQYSDDQQELVCLTSVVTDEDLLNNGWKPYFNFSPQHIKEYLPQLMTSDIVGEVSYTYGSRLRNFRGKINQIDSMVAQLKNALYSRRAVGVTWDVEEDHDHEHSPCLNLMQSLAQEKLHMTFYVRSNDMFRAWPLNAIAFRKIQKEVAEKVGVEPGNLIIISNSAHIYSPCWKQAKEVIEEHPVTRASFDPRGNILIETHKDKIKLTHLSPQGKKIREVFALDAKDAYSLIEQNRMISQTSHALDIGVELGKAETAIKMGLDYVQDKDFT